MVLMTDYWVLDGIVIITILFISYYYLYMTRSFKYWEKRGVSQVPPTIFYGNFRECRKQQKAPSYYLKELYERAKDINKPYIGFYISEMPILLLRDRKLIERVLITDCPSYFYNRYSSANPNDRIGYSNLFFLKDRAWLTLKKNLAPFFNNSSLEKMFDLMLECGKHLDKYLHSLKLDGNGQIIDVMDVSSKLTMDVICSTAYGLDKNTFKDPDFSKLCKMILKENYKRDYEMLHIFFVPGVARMANLKVFGKKTTNFLRNIFWESMIRRMESGGKRYDLIDILVELKNNNTFDDDELLAQAACFFSAGFETCSTTTAFALYELAVQPEIQNTLRKELLEALEKSKNNVTYNMVWSLPYLDMVVSETLRMYPPLGFLNRMAIKYYEVPGSDLILEPGTPVYISILGLHYDPEYFLNPNKFDPERFNKKNKRKRKILPFVYLPFGEGPRGCISQRFALLQTKLALLKILSKYEVTLCEETSVPVEIDPKGVIAVPLNGVLYLNCRKINTNAI